MAKTITLTVDGQSCTAELNDSPAAAQLAAVLPLTVRMSRWGDEYYGSCPLSITADDTSREIMEVGEIAYWPPGSALCLFFGPTPASTDDRPRAASPVVPLGKIIAGVEQFKRMGGSIQTEIA